MARITIVLELDGTADAPVGQARLPDGTARAFHGWLGLSEVIDACIRREAGRDAASPGPTTGPENTDARAMNTNPGRSQHDVP